MRICSLRELPSAIMLLSVEQERIKANQAVLVTAARVRIGMTLKSLGGAAARDGER